MPDTVLAGRYYLTAEPNAATIGAIIEELLRYGCKYEKNPIIEYYLEAYRRLDGKHITNEKTYQELENTYRNTTEFPINKKYFLEFIREFKLKEPIDIIIDIYKPPVPHTTINIGIILSITDVKDYLGGSNIHIEFEYLPFDKINNMDIIEWTKIASLIWKKLNALVKVKHAHWITYSDDYPEGVKIGSIGWINIFSPQLTNKIAREKLLKAPAWKIEEIADDTIIIIASETIGDRNETIATNALAQYLGAKDGVLKID